LSPAGLKAALSRCRFAALIQQVSAHDVALCPGSLDDRPIRERHTHRM
jgi:hypothetical protein